jgi:hypothetical protein
MHSPSACKRHQARAHNLTFGANLALMLSAFAVFIVDASDHLAPCSADLLFTKSSELVGPGIEAYLDADPGHVCNQILMMGEARAGKSWFLNYFSDSPGCFMVGNSTQPVTQGADIMYTLLERRQLFGIEDESGEDNPEDESGEENPIWVPIVDMQGTGDDSTDVDAKLALPLLLTSHVVFFFTNTHPGKHKVRRSLEQSR